MVEHRQQLRPLVGGFDDPVIEGGVARLPVDEGVERGGQPRPFGGGGGVPIGQQIAIERPVVRPEGVEQGLMVGTKGRSLA